MLDTLTIRSQAELIAEQVLPTGGHPLAIADQARVQLLLAALADGNYRETACAVAGIAKKTFYNMLKRAEGGDEAAIAFVHAVENAEASAEAEMVGCVRNAAKKGPQYWAAGATFLERKSPERWGRRTDEGNAPKVVVQIGVSSGDVTVNVTSAQGESRPPDTPLVLDHAPTTTDGVIQLTERLLSDANEQRRLAQDVTVQASELPTPPSTRRGKSGGDPTQAAAMRRVGRGLKQRRVK